MRVPAVALLIVCGAAGCARSRPAPAPSPTPVPVPVVAAREGAIHPQLVLPGIVAPIQTVTLTSSLSEPAVSVNVSEGQQVSSGEVLATLDTADLRANLEAAQRSAAEDRAKLSQAVYQAQQTASQATNGVTSAQASLTQARRKLDLDQLTLTRDEELLAQGYIARQTADQQRALVAQDEAAVRSAEAALRSAQTTAQTSGSASGGANEANIAAARAAYASAQAQADQIRTQIAKATIRSPIAGVVVNRNLNPGEYPGTRQIFTIQKLSRVYVNLSASSGQVFRVHRGDAVRVGGPSLRGARYSGKVVAVLGQLTPGSTNFTVKAEVANPDRRLQSGMVVTGTVVLPPQHGVIVPSNAFLTPSRDRLMIDSNGVAQTRAVHEIASSGDESVVTGISAGTTVIANGELGLADGEQVAAR